MRKECEYCGKTFEKKGKSNQGWTNRKFCSHSCSVEKRKGWMPLSSIAAKSCEKCGATIDPPKTRREVRYFERRKWCSNKCASSAGYRRSSLYKSRLAKPNCNNVVESMLESGEARIHPDDERYAITISGDVYSRAVWGHPEKIGPRWRKMSLFQRKKETTYLSVPMGWGNIRFVHQLVLEVFEGPRPEGMQVRHLDGNPRNNHLTNLMYGTGLENAADRAYHSALKRMAHAQTN